MITPVSVYVVFDSKHEEAAVRIETYHEGERSIEHIRFCKDKEELVDVILMVERMLKLLGHNDVRVIKPKHAPEWWSQND